jgi:hypothetical protein
MGELGGRQENGTRGEAHTKALRHEGVGNVERVSVGGWAEFVEVDRVKGIFLD